MQKSWCISLSQKHPPGCYNWQNRQTIPPGHLSPQRCADEGPLLSCQRKTFNGVKAKSPLPAPYTGIQFFSDLCKYTLQRANWTQSPKVFKTIRYNINGAIQQLSYSQEMDNPTPSVILIKACVFYTLGEYYWNRPSQLCHTEEQPLPTGTWTTTTAKWLSLSSPRWPKRHHYSSPEL